MKKIIINKTIKSIIIIALFIVFSYYTANAIIWNKIDDTIRNMVIASDPITIHYNNKTVYTDYIFADIYAYLTLGDKKLINYDTICSQEKIIIKNKDIYIEVFNKDDHDIYLHVRLNSIINPTYQVMGIGNFQKILGELSELTGNAIFVENVY